MRALANLNPIQMGKKGVIFEVLNGVHQLKVSIKMVRIVWLNNRGDMRCGIYETTVVRLNVVLSFCIIQVQICCSTYATFLHL